MSLSKWRRYAYQKSQTRPRFQILHWCKYWNSIVTSYFRLGHIQAKSTAEWTYEFQKIVLWPNVDAGSNDVSKAIRTFRENQIDLSKFYFIKNLSPEDYAILLNNAICCVGNSSSFIRECSFLGVPSVIIGDRQSKREHGINAIFCEHNHLVIQEKIKSQIKKNRYKKQTIFGEGNAGVKIAQEISKNLNKSN